MHTASPAEVISLALALPESARLEVAAELLASVKPPGVLSADDPGFAEEIRRRCNEVDAGKAELLDYQESMARIRANLKAQPRT
jgi:hypothetical protein